METATPNNQMIKTKVLYVDDEKSNLVSFKASFRQEFDVLTANSAAEGLEMLENELDTHVVIADQRMPEMTGVQFLAEIRPRYPDIVRILLTGYSDIEAVIGAINKGQVYRYINKPWDYENIRIALRNAREIYDTKKELKEKNRRLEKALKELDQFVYSVSHDIRAPLTSIQGIINLALLESTENSSKEYFEMIKSMVDKLDTFVHQVIDYYYGNRHNKNFDEIDFASLMENITEGYQYDPETKDIDIRVKLDIKEPFVSNKIKMRIILANLIANSIKYQREDNGDKWVRVEITTDKEKANILVEDNGIGIEKEQLERVFEMFHRASHKSIGSGLGLYIVKDSVESLDGDIKMSSQPDKGTKVEITLPNLRQQELLDTKLS